MSLMFPKNPQDMTNQELFDMLQKAQKLAKSQGQHYPMYTKTTLPQGQQPTVNDMHEGAARTQLAALYEKQNAPATAAPAAANTSKPAAQNTPSAEPAAKPEPTPAPTPAKTSTGSLLDALVPSAAAADDRSEQDTMNRTILDMAKDTVGKYAPEVLKAPLKEAELLHDTGKAAAETAAAYALVRKYGFDNITEQFKQDGRDELTEGQFRDKRFPACLAAAQGDKEKAEQIYQGLLILFNQGKDEIPKRNK